jgi:hypothetical protein
MIFTEDHEILMPTCKHQLFTFDAGERLERRTRRAAAIGAMAIGRVEKLIWNRIRNGAAETFSGKYPNAHL